MHGIIDSPKFNYEDLEDIVAGQVDRVHLEFIGNASRYIHTHCAIAFIVCSIQVFRSHNDKV